MSFIVSFTQICNPGGLLTETHLMGVWTASYPVQPQVIKYGAQLQVSCWLKGAEA